MIKKIITSYTIFLCIAIAISGISIASASEVTGTLSSDSADNTPSGGNISGTVSSGNGGGSSSRGSRNNGNLSNAPSGSVLGASTSNMPTPGFPNAGFVSEEVPTNVTVWSKVVTFFKNLISF